MRCWRWEHEEGFTYVAAKNLREASYHLPTTVLASSLQEMTEDEMASLPITGDCNGQLDLLLNMTLLERVKVWRRDRLHGIIHHSVG